MTLRRSPSAARTGQVPFALVGMLSIIVMILLILMALRLRPDAQRASADDTNLRVYCASGIAKPVQELIDDFNERMGARVEIVRTGGSGELAGQVATEFESGVERGADLVVLADDLLLEKGRDGESIAEIFPAAIQRPVIAVAADSQLEIDSLADLVNRPGLNYGLTSNRAAIGKLAREVAGRDGLLEPLEANRKTDAENVMTLAQALVTGNLDAAILWDTTVNQLNQANQQPVLKIAALVDPQDEFSGEVGLGVVSTTRHPTLAIQFARYATAPETGNPTFRQFGFTAQPGDQWEEVPEIHLYLGSMFTPVLEQQVREFARRQGINVYPRWEGCGKLVASINSITDPDLFPDAFLACDFRFLEQVQDRFESPVTISSNEIVMAVQRSQAEGIESPQDLLASDLRIGICEPEQSALGWLTRQLLSSPPYAGLYEQLEARSAVTVDVGPTLVSQLLAGGLDAALVYRSNVMADPQSMQQIEIISLAPSTHSRAVQPWAISKGTKNRQLMQRLLEMIVRSDTINRFEQAGFQVETPEKD
ncbi:MAG: substrate-binding domain-containing protein [Mariniblastus sp.]|nr:substrate-binding domain-containing protein [Mariniblastus sp.]